MDNNWISYFPFSSVEEGLSNAGAELMLRLQRKVSDDLKEGLKRQNIADIFSHLKYFSEEGLEGREYCWFERSDVVKQVVEFLQYKRVKFILFISWQILEDNRGERTQQLQQNLNILHLREISPRQDDEFPTL